MRDLINIFVRRPVTVIMILAGIIIAAVFSLFTLPVNRLPEFSVPRVTVEALYPGMAANEVRSLVTIPLEDSLSPVKGLEKMQSVSRDSRLLISMDFRWGTNPMAASVLVREAIDTIYPSLPEGVRKPTVTTGDSVGESHAVIAVNAHNGNAEFARKLAEYELHARLRRIDGVGSVILVGGEVAEEHLLLDTERLTAFGLAPSEFAGLLAQETANIPAGNAREGNMELVVISSGRPDSTSALSHMILPVANGTLTVQDAGQLRSSSAKRGSVFVYNGKEAAALEIYRRPGSDPLRLSRDIKKTIDEANTLFSRDAQIEIVSDSTPSLVNGIISLLISAALGVAAVISVLLIFIRRIKYCLLVSLSIPVSAAAGICVLSIAGKSLNSMSLGGLAMGIGLVSDISVIVLDLLHRTFGKRDSFPEPHEIGDRASSIAGSSIASTLTTALVFVPIIFLPGPLGSLFGDIAIAIVSSITAGWFYAQFCLPSLYRMFFNNRVVQLRTANLRFDGTMFQNNFRWKNVFTDGSLEKNYLNILSFLLHRPKKFFSIVVFLVFSGIVMILMRPMVFVNPDEAEEVFVSVVYPPGTLLETTTLMNINISKIISELPSVKTVYGKIGAEEGDVGRRADIDYVREELILHCILEKQVKPQKALAEIYTSLNSVQLFDGTSYDEASHDGASFSVFLPRDRTEVLLGLSTGHTFIIKGKDREELQERTEIVENIFKTSSIKVNFRPRGHRPELRLYPSREASAYLSVPASQIAETLYVLNEGIVATRLEIEGRPLDVRVIGQNAGCIDSNYNNSDFIDPVKRLEQIPLRTPQGKTVYLGSLGRIRRMETEASLARLDRCDVIYADIFTGEKIPDKVKETASGFSWFTGANESVFTRYRNSLLLYVILVLILLYMTMGAQFESFLLPLILMISIPFSLAGAGPMLLITGERIDSGAILGLTALFGLVVNNSLVLFEISDEKINIGLLPIDAVFRGASERLQAILITTATTVFALFPLVISPMGNSQKSMAAAMLGGLAASTLLSLFAIPPVLIHFFKWKLRGKGLK